MIIVAVPCLLKGGTEFQTLHLVKALVSLKQQVKVLVYFEKDRNMVGTFQEAGAEVVFLDWERSIKPWIFILRLSRLFKILKPDIAHIQYMAPGALPIFAAKIAAVSRIIATVHQPYTASHGRFAKFILRFAARFCGPFLSVSQNAEHSWFGTSHLLNPKIPINRQARHLTLYNTIDVIRLQEILRISSDKENEGTIVIGTVSRMRLEKGLDILIKAFARLVEEFPEARLNLVGDGPDKRAYEALTKDLGVDSNITFFGAADWGTAMVQMAKMDVVVVPSRFEGFGLTAAEAMGMGKPVIVSDTFGLKELIAHEVDGLQFENGNVADLAEKLRTLITQSELRKRLGQQALEKAKSQFDFPIFVENVRMLYGIKA